VMRHCVVFCCHLYVERFEKLYSTLNRLMVEGDLLEVSMPEKLLLRSVLRTCRPADYEQIVFGFPVNIRHLYIMCTVFIFLSHLS